MSNLLGIGLDELVSSFDSRGYDLITDSRRPFSLTVEETIVGALINPKARLLEGIPVLLAKNKVDYEALKKLIDRYQVWNEFGYFGDFTLKHIKDDILRNLVHYCHAKLKPSATLSHLPAIFFKDSQKKEERYWQVIGAPSYSILDKQYLRYYYE